MGSKFGNFVRGVGSAGMNVTRAATRAPFLKAVPGLGTALTVASIGLTGYQAMTQGGGGGGGLPPSPFGPAGSMNGPGGGFAGFSGGMVGKRTVFGNDPNVPDNLKSQVISKGNLRTYYRAPKGFVVMKDSVGDPMGVPKYIAKMYGWKPAKKPLLSIRDTNAIRHSGAVIKKLKTFNKTVEKIANFHAGARRSAPRNIIIEQSGRKVIGRKVA